jgi:hypothetical protein
VCGSIVENLVLNLFDDSFEQVNDLLFVFFPGPSALYNAAAEGVVAAFDEVDNLLLLFLPDALFVGQGRPDFLDLCAELPVYLFVDVPAQL